MDIRGSVREDEREEKKQRKKKSVKDVKERGRTIFIKQTRRRK